jgi:hypothetical protein
MKMRKSTLLRGLKKIRSNEDEKINATKGASNNTVYSPPRHCGLDPQSPQQQEILKQVQNDVVDY